MSIRRGWRGLIGAAALAVGSLLAMPAAAGPYSDAVLAKNPYAYWRFNEASGAATALDSSGNNRHGSYGGAVLGQAGPLAEVGNTALGFNLGSFVGVQVNDSFGGAGWNQVSIEAWVNIAGGTGNWQPIVDAGLTAGFVQIATQELGTAIELYGANGGGIPHVLLAPGSAALTGWTQMVVTTNGSDHRLYLDAVLVAAVTSAPIGDLLPASTLYLGNSPFVGAFNGGMDEVAIYRSVLSQAQIAQNFAAASQVAQTATPEPASVGVLGLGILALGGLLGRGRLGRGLRSA
jgi:hypothetical protein